MPDDMDISFVVPCDDIRREDNGKLIAIGLYGENLTIRKAPLQMPMSFIIWANANEISDYEADIEIFLEPEKSAVARLKFGFSAGEKSKRIAIPIPAISLNIGGPGALVMRQKIVEGEKEVLRLPILRGEPNVSPPPS
ncbi:hypothetical protein [Sneathiella sp.]|uniref:hypothetical protein n=1 Tax=Sneathiella sp. TaxID=1964365 RepID=UPI0025FD3044|nr:hypothetical protein [Sneathiella sp.]|tara:strand:+ start:1142 stop:1555 length:414 start_codon:yes stop_codon:yes gene_type:complete